MTYAQAKDMLILEGDGRSDAKLFKQEAKGGEESQIAAQKILYFPKTNQVNLDGVHLLNMNQVPGKK